MTLLFSLNMDMGWGAVEAAPEVEGHGVAMTGRLGGMMVR
jgi:hypothetical protein